MPDNEKIVKDLFDGYAVKFDSIYGGSRGWFQRLMDKWFRKSMLIRFQKTIETCEPLSGKRILDVGCGPGHYSVLLAQKGAAHVLGVDFSSSMIEIAKQHAAQNQVAAQCDFIESDILQYSSGQPFDCTVAMGVMDYIPEPLPFLQHLMKLTKGKVMLSFPKDGGLLAWQRRLRYRWFNNCELYMYTPESLASLMEQAAPNRYTIEKIDRDFFVVIETA